MELAVSRQSDRGHSPRLQCTMHEYRVHIQRLPPLLLLALALCVRIAHAAVCLSTGLEAPPVVTLMASRTNPATDAWVVEPNCVTSTISLSYSSYSLDVGRKDVERVDSVPSNTNSVVFYQNSLSRGADLSRATQLTNVDVPLVVDLVLPQTVTNLVLKSPTSASVTGFAFPEKLETLIIFMPLQSLSGVKLPASLDEIRMDYTVLTAIDFAMPPQLTKLSLRSKTISKIERVSFPDSLAEFSCSSCGITTIRGIKWPRSLRNVNLDDNAVVNFEIRQADLALWRSIPVFTARIAQSKCADPTAKMEVIKGNRVCVIDDDRFEAIYVYGNGITPTAPGTSGAAVDSSQTTPQPEVSSERSGSGSLSSTPGGSRANSNGSALADSTPSTAAEEDARASLTGNSTTLDVRGSHSGSQKGDVSGSTSDASQPRSPRKPGSSTASTDASSSSSTGKMALVLGVCGGGVVLFALIGFVGYATRRRRAKEADLEAKYDLFDTPTTNSSSQASFNAYLKNDVRNDKALIPFRIEQSDVVLGEKIAHNSSSVVYRATFQDADVAVKRLVPGAWEIEGKLGQFMDEIRTCASLEHHKIVAFIGISWSSLRDLSVVMEFMAAGDLSTLLQNQHERSAPHDWFYSWTSMQIKSKASIAQDVAEAVVYLHSFNSPILHRNLKAQNILLDEESNAKLGGFGVSRESAMDSMMTGEIGTTAWMAPEVLRGARYDEKADIYSLGVLMVELDRCQHPFASQTRPGSPSQDAVDSVAYNNTQIAVLVSSGKLRPAFSSECPPAIASLVNNCLSFDPTNRPTSLEVFYRLRQAQGTLDGGAAS